MDALHILLVESDPDTRVRVEARLWGAGFKVRAVASSAAALELIGAGEVAAVVTDLLIDEHCDGLSLLRRAKASDPDLEVLVLTAATSFESVVAALHLRAHSFLRKPARPGELEERLADALARRRCALERTLALRQLVSQLMRLAEPQGPGYMVGGPVSARLRVGRLELDPDQRRLAIDQQTVPISSGEFDLLHYLARHGHQVVTVDQLAREALACGCGSTAEARERVKMRIHRLRRKIERDPSNPCLLVSVRGAGYMLTSDQ